MKASDPAINPGVAGFATIASEEPFRPIPPGKAVLSPDPNQPRRTYLQQVIYDTLQNRTAVFGLIWIGILAFFACFAPFIANSHPILMKADGRWSSPLFAYLEPVDVVMAVAGVTAAVLLMTRRMSLGKGIGLVFWTACAAFVAAGWPSTIRYWHTLNAQFGTPATVTIFILVPIGLLATLIFLPRLFDRQPMVLAGSLMLGLAAFLLVFPIRPPLVTVYERYRQLEEAGAVQNLFRTIIPYSANDRLRDHPEERLLPPSAKHWLGTEANGADMLSRMIHACRIALSIGFIATGIAVAIGIIVGGLMGYFAGTLDMIGMRLIEIFEAIPRLVLLIAVTAFFGRSLYLMMVVIGLVSWTGDARFIRAEFLRLRKQDFVQAALACGLPKRSIIFRHMLPNGISPVLVSASFGVASAILLESVLSFLGLGLVEEPSWGQMLNQARAGGTGFNWWIAIFPGFAIFLTVFSYVLVGEAMRDALDPKLRKAE